MHYPPEFTIAFVVHDDVPLLERTVPTSIAALTQDTDHSYDLILVIDGAESAPVGEILGRAEAWGFDEVRLRRRSRHAAPGDPSNNGHLHLLPVKGRFLVSMEGDVVAFRCGGGDPLHHIATVFTACPDLALATRIDDHDCWKWPLSDAGPVLAAGVRSVNRVASHFLVFDVARASRTIWQTGGPPAGSFYDGDACWFNYEDWLSHIFAAPIGPGIGYLDQLPLRIYHCDEKTESGAPTYTKNLHTRLRVFERRQRELGETTR